MTRREYKNKLNELSPKEWLKFQKSWFIHNPPRRRQEVVRHPAKFPETLAQEFIEFFTRAGEFVFDPMCGTGSTLVAAQRCARSSIGIELNPAYAEIARNVLAAERATLDPQPAPLQAFVITGNAEKIAELIAGHPIPPVDYLLTSPPYWNMLHAGGAKTQRTRRNSPALDVFYSDDPADLGNIADYDEFITRLVLLFVNLRPLLRPHAYLTIILKNVKKGGKIYPLAWDFAGELGKYYALKDEKIWLQDNQSLAPYGMGNAWVSNTFHHYCLQFRND